MSHLQQIGGSQIDMIRNLHEKLTDHQHQIDSRNKVIEDLEKQVIQIKQELSNERLTLLNNTEQHTKLLENFEKLNIRFKQSTLKYLHIQQIQLNTAIKNLFLQEIESWDQIVVDNYENGYSSIQILISYQKLTNIQKRRIAGQMFGNGNRTLKRKRVRKQQASRAQRKLSILKELLKMRLKDQARLEKINRNLNQHNQHAQLEKSQRDIEQNEHTIRTMEKEKQDIIKENVDLRQQLLQQKHKYEKLVIFANEKIKHQKDDQDKLSELQRLMQRQEESLGRVEEEKDFLKEGERVRDGEIKRLRDELHRKEAKILELESKGNIQREELLKQITSLKDQVLQLNKNISYMKSKQDILKINLDKLVKGEEEIQKSLKCNYCSQFIQEPVTIIPCGHSYCLGCKKAYSNQCIKCGPKIQVEAIYRNELLDDVIGVFRIITALKQSLVNVFSHN